MGCGERPGFHRASLACEPVRGSVPSCSNETCSPGRSWSTLRRVFAIDISHRGPGVPRGHIKEFSFPPGLPPPPARLRRSPSSAFTETRTTQGSSRTRPWFYGHVSSRQNWIVRCLSVCSYPCCPIPRPCWASPYSPGTEILSGYIPSAAASSLASGSWLLTGSPPCQEARCWSI